MHHLLENFADSKNPSPIYGSYYILRGRIKGFNSSITTILFEVGSYRTVVGGHYRTLE